MNQSYNGEIPNKTKEVGFLFTLTLNLIFLAFLCTVSLGILLFMHMRRSFFHNVNFVFCFFNRRKWIVNSKILCKLVGKGHDDFR